jgi:tetratricopeptide (TPR) repeat protein
MAWRRMSCIVVALALVVTCSTAAESVRSAPSAKAQDNARGLVARGLDSAARGKNDDALLDYTRAISLNVFSDGDLARVLFDRGVTLDAMGRTNDAIGDYSAALKHDPEFAAALNNRGNAYRRLNRLDEARQDYAASLAARNTTPEYPDYGLGQIAEARGDFEAARRFYGEALAANPAYAPAAMSLEALEHKAAHARAPLVLKPPPARPAPRPVKVAVQPVAAPAGPTLAPASYGRADADPGLRPAIEDAPRAVQTGGLVQLGAWRDEASAAEGWNHIQELAGDTLAGLKPQIVAVDLPGKGRYYRLRAGPVGRGGGTTLCEALTAKGLACMVVKGN